MPKSVGFVTSCPNSPIKTNRFLSGVPSTSPSDKSASGSASTKEPRVCATSAPSTNSSNKRKPPRFQENHTMNEDAFNQLLRRCIEEGDVPLELDDAVVDHWLNHETP